MAAEHPVLLMEDTNTLCDNVVHLYAVREAVDDPLTIPPPAYTFRWPPRPLPSFHHGTASLVSEESKRE
ncbi:MAG: hypothetical protein ACJ8AW_30900 [Rhodopila sp.]